MRYKTNQAAGWNHNSGQQSKFTSDSLWDSRCFYRKWTRKLTEKRRATVTQGKKAAVLRPAPATVAYRRLWITLLGAIDQLIPWQVFQCTVLTGHLWPPSGFALGPPHTHTYTHPALTAAPIRQHKVLLLPPPNPGCPSRQESKARLNLERVNKVEERKKERHRPSPTSLLPVLLFAR